MKKRVIGSIFFLLIVYISILIDHFTILNLLFLIIGTYEMIMITKGKKKSAYSLIYAAIFFLGIATLNVIDGFGGWYIFLFVSEAMLVDTFAFLVGRKYGKTKISEISPNKTVEGLLGGIGCTLIIFYIFIYIVDKPFELTIFSQIPLYISSIIAILTGVTAFFGDLLESKLKRIYDVKDSGTIIYGHGGILDRIDSWILGSIFFALMLQLIL